VVERHRGKIYMVEVHGLEGYVVRKPIIEGLTMKIQMMEGHMEEGSLTRIHMVARHMVKRTLWTDTWRRDP
jgi:hypothetical protein